MKDRAKIGWCAVPRTYLLWATAAAGFAVDQSTKAIAAVTVEGRPPTHALGGRVTFTAFRNSGAAGSFAPHATLVFTLLAVAMLAVIARVGPSVRSAGWAVGLGLISAGAAGNLTDRLFRTPGFGRGAVLDFIQIGHSGIFNLADQCITAGALTILVQTFRGIPLRSEKPTPRASERVGSESEAASVPHVPHGDPAAVGRDKQTPDIPFPPLPR